jgi:hypothetical protein
MLLCLLAKLSQSISLQLLIIAASIAILCTSTSAIAAAMVK